MTEPRGRTFADLVASLNAGQHLAMDAVVAFVDGELAPAAHERAAAHLMGCQYCGAEIAAQRQTRSVVRSARCPSVPADLLAALCDIPHTADLADLPPAADPGQRSAGQLGGSSRWGSGPSVLGRRRIGR
jgi:anti-sigma factor RsiW